jgi:predicted ATP-grasp superfamily ATP-dependent carboligase
MSPEEMSIQVGNEQSHIVQRLPVAHGLVHGRRSPASPGVIILGIEYQALGLLRQLASIGISCVMVDEDRWGPARFSRWRSLVFQSPAYESEEFWPWLLRLQEAQGLDGWVLIPTHDEQVRQIALHHEEASVRFRFAGPRWETYEALYDKRRAYEWCQVHGVAAPRSYLPSDRKDSPTGTLEYPLIVKPAVKPNFKRYSNAKAIRADSPEDLEQLLAGRLASVPVKELLYQEIIPGDGRQQWSYAGFFVDGRPIAAFTARRLRQHPPDFGRASTYVAAVHDPEVERESRRVLSLLQYTGLAEVEWKRDARDGRLKFLEVNARSWGWHSLASQVVGDLAPLLYRYLVHGDVKPSAPRYGARWVKHITDIPVVFDLRRRGELTFREYLTTLRGDLTGCEWHWRDPLPFLAQFLLIPYLLKHRGY